MMSSIDLLYLWKNTFALAPVQFSQNVMARSPAVLKKTSAAKKSVSVVERETRSRCLLLDMMGQLVCEPRVTQWIPDIERGVSPQPAESAPEHKCGDMSVMSPPTHTTKCHSNIILM